MKKFIILYKGPATPPDASHEGWPEWFEKIGGALIDIGSPMMGGHTIYGNGSADDSATSFNGYGIIQAEDMAQAMRLLKDHPYLAMGDEYAIEVFEVPKK